MAFARRAGARLLALLPRPRSRACAGTMAQPRCFALELPGCALAHFAVGTAAEGTAAPGALPDPRAAALLGPPGRSYSLCVPVAPGRDCAARVRAARLHQRLLQQLRRGPLKRCQLRRLLCYCPSGGVGGLQQGVLLHDPCDSPDTRRALLALLDSYVEAPRPCLGEFMGDPRHQLWQRPWELRDGQGWRQVDPEPVVSAPEPTLHPVVPDLPSSGVFPHREAARAVLEACTPFIPEARAMLDLVSQCPAQVQKGKFPVIVIEGLDATGKTTVTQAVSDALKAVLLKSPPASISQWRKVFDDEPTIIRRAFYSLGNYIVASEIAKASVTSPVVVDRYWHSTATYAIATEVSGTVHHLPPAHHPIYQWPKDLLKPDLVLLLTVSPEERLNRIQGRGLERTREETELEANSIFRQKVEVSYQRMESPGCRVVDASPCRETVLQTVLSLIQSHCKQS
ncbi:UMP-CMP kinase 2, mitochondrial [Molossus molossus]|uniref:UMP-CMP kinase 2, mitochondrial n=1 Tax=Molossus molossus TaxID=27622 RepID=A0A7J8E146_MOLMO|nr:UMP-CMP kinase 2, mitochondrial [Molossus molossus]KAF6429133.1 cytidine/uridine monophosphate kinase 2 [Molossus molossus]